MKIGNFLLGNLCFRSKNRKFISQQFNHLVSDFIVKFRTQTGSSLLTQITFLSIYHNLNQIKTPKSPYHHTHSPNFRHFVSPGQASSPLALTTLCIIDRNDSSTFRIGIFFFLLCKKSGHSLLLCHLAISNQAGIVADIITFSQPLYLLTGIFRAFKSICNLPFCHAIFNLVFPAMLWFSLITFQTACAWLSMITMLITNQAVHPTGSKHDRLYLFWHLHLQSSKFIFLPKK